MALKSLSRDENADDILQSMINMKYDFDLYTSNYTMKIVFDEETINFTKRNQSRQCFAAFSKIKMDIKDKKIPKVYAEDVSYFIHDFKSSIYVDEVFNIDLKSAYANILYSDGYISKETFKYLSKLPKQDRLSSVGMLASHKEVFSFKNGEPGSVNDIRSEYSGFFFYAAKRTFEIMHELKAACGNDYLFTWVDGIYFLPNSQTFSECKKILGKIGIPFSTDLLKEFEVNVKPKCISISFLKDSKKKCFNLPIEDSHFKKIASTILINNNFKKNKKSSLTFKTKNK